MSRPKRELTGYQLAVLRSAAAGATVEETARLLGKSRPAIASCIITIRHRLGAQTIAHAVSIAYERNILTSPRETRNSQP